MRENEELFRKANERLREQVADDVQAGRVVPFLCECADDLCMARMEMTFDDYLGVRADSDTFAVVPGHAVDGEVVVRELSSFHVVRKEAA